MFATPNENALLAALGPQRTVFRGLNDAPPTEDVGAAGQAPPRQPGFMRPAQFNATQFQSPATMSPQFFFRGGI